MVFLNISNVWNIVFAQRALHCERMSNLCTHNQLAKSAQKTNVSLRRRFLVLGTSSLFVPTARCLVLLPLHMQNQIVAGSHYCKWGTSPYGRIMSTVSFISDLNCRSSLALVATSIFHITCPMAPSYALIQPNDVPTRDSDPAWN